MKRGPLAHTLMHGKQAMRGEDVRLRKVQHTVPLPYHEWVHQRIIQDRKRRAHGPYFTYDPNPRSQSS